MDPKNQKMASFTTYSCSEANKIQIDEEINKKSGEAESSLSRQCVDSIKLIILAYHRMDEMS